MIIRLIDKKGFSKLVQTDCLDPHNGIIKLPIPLDCAKVFANDSIDLSDTLEVIDFRYNGRSDYDHNYIFDEV